MECLQQAPPSGLRNLYGRGARCYSYHPVLWKELEEQAGSSSQLSELGIPKASLHSLSFILFQTGSLSVAPTSLECPMLTRLPFELTEIHLLESKACTTITQPSPCFSLWPIDVTRSEMVNFSFSHEMEPYRPIPHTLFPHSLRKNSYGRTLADYLKPESRELVKVNLCVSPYSSR